MRILFLLLLIQNVLQRQCRGENNWKIRQKSYVSLPPPDLQDRLLRMSDYLIKHYAIDMENMNNFNLHLKKILIPRVPGSRGSQIVRQHIKESMKNLGWNVKVQTFTNRNNVLNRPIQFNNIIATLDENAPRRLIIACHYDSKITPRNFLAATDSAVPCSQMINLATVMKEELDHTKTMGAEVTLQFIFFDGEEAFKTWDLTDSLYGSRHLASVWEKQTGYRHQGFPRQGDNTLGRIDVFMLLDLLGANNPEPTILSGHQATHNWYKRLRAIEQMLVDNKRKYGILHGTRKRIFVTSGDRASFSTVEDDHTPFLKRGVPILHMIAQPFPTMWHNSGDNLNNVHLPTVEKLNKIFRLFVAEYLQLYDEKEH